MPGLFPYYYGGIRVSDGVDSVFDRPAKIVCSRGRLKTVIKTYCQGEAIGEIKVTAGNRLVEWQKYGAFHRGYKTFMHKNISAPVIMRYLPNSRYVLHGICERWDQKLFSNPGKCRTQYSHGRVLWQEFRYRNGRPAYRMKASDKFVLIRHPDGSNAAVIGCGSKGFSVRSGKATAAGTHTCEYGEMYFNGKSGEGYSWRSGGGGGDRKHDYSRDGNCSFNFWDRRGRLYAQGEYQNRQKSGEWIEAGKHVYYANGVIFSKKLWETPPEKLKAKTVLRVRNAQMRMALIARMGYERFCKGIKSKLIHEDKGRRNKLLELPIKVNDGEGGRIGSMMRILVVTCTSTGQEYYLNVPDWVRDGGKRTKLNTCEQARQWTFHQDDPRKRIEFAIET